MKSYQTAAGLAALISTVSAHGYLKSPQPRMPGDALKAACGQQYFSMFSSDINGNVQTALQVAKSQSDFDAAKCNPWTCKGMQFADNTANVQSWTAGQTVSIVANIAAPHTGVANVSILDTTSSSPIGQPLISWSVYASTATGVTKNETNFDVTIPSDLGDKCSQAGACTLQWWWDSRQVDQTYESCIDFTVGGSGSGSGPVPAPSASAVASSAPVASVPVATPSAPAVETATAVATQTVVVQVPSSTAVAPAASATSVPGGSGTGNKLPEEFTIQEFISWLKQETNSGSGSGSYRRDASRLHPRAFA